MSSLDTMPVESWTDRYKPTKVSDLICNSGAVAIVKKWLDNWYKIRDSIKEEDFIKNEQQTKDKVKSKVKKTKPKLKSKSNLGNSCLIVNGMHGIGKTVTVETVVRECGYDIKRVDFNIIKIGKNIKSIMQQIMNSSNILDMINSKTTKFVLIFDELESISSVTEKAFITAVQKLNDIEWHIPIIFISNNKHNKLLIDIKKGSLEVKMYKPYNSDLEKILKKICQKERIHIDNQSIVTKILDHCQSDIRRLINTLQDLYYTYPNEPITINIINEYCSVSKKKDMDKDLFKATAGLLDMYTGIDDCLTYYETEKVILPLMVHQNYMKKILMHAEADSVDDTDSDVSETEKADKILLTYNTMSTISELLSVGDVLENYIYGDQSWDMQEIHGFFTCAASSYYLNDYTNKMLEDQLDLFGDNSNTAGTGSDLTFTVDFNKTSIKKINKKNIINAEKCFHNMDIFDYIHITKILRKLLNTGSKTNSGIKECIDLMSNYNVKLVHIESLLKIDKISGCKTSLTSRQKKEIIKYLGDGV